MSPSDGDNASRPLVRPAPNTLMHQKVGLTSALRALPCCRAQPRRLERVDADNTVLARTFRCLRLDRHDSGGGGRPRIDIAGSQSSRDSDLVMPCLGCSCIDIAHSRADCLRCAWCGKGHAHSGSRFVIDSHAIAGRLPGVSVGVLAPALCCIDSGEIINRFINLPFNFL